MIIGFMAVPIEKLQLEKLLDERRPDFFMAAYRDIEGQIHIHFKLQIFVKLAGKKQQIDLLLVVPPDADFANASTPYPISNIDDLSHDASAIHEAGLTNTQHVFRIQFNLTTKGFVVTKKKTTAIRPHTTTTNMLIRRLESLSNTTIFSVYMRPSTYAEVDLAKLRTHFSKPPTATDTCKTNLKEMYIQQGAMLLEWDKFEYKKQQHPIPPTYAQSSPEVQSPPSPPRYAQSSPEVQVRQSPPVDAQLAPEAQVSQSSLIIFEDAIGETPARTPISPNSTSVHGIFSSCEESSDSEVNLADIEKDIMLDWDVDSDEEQLAREQLANLNSQELSHQFDYDSAVSQMLKSKLEKWIETVLSTNTDVHFHTRLTTKLAILGHCVRTSNVNVFDNTLLWCSALFFYDPLDSDPGNTFGLWETTNSWLIRDIAKQIQWADKIRCSTEMSSSLLEHFIKLGHAARIVALDPRCNQGVYLKQKSVFIAYILAEFGKPGSISKENNEPISRKSWGTNGNAPKRVKI
ncbi:proline-rich receptor kinase perk4-like protein [Rutstroemia sp. NJR-2017a WRK4]|nr:proline-rich receptor kinase perk4-like protein [Rutstroemia sp. NJR-2017a WRK4]